MYFSAALLIATMSAGQAPSTPSVAKPELCILRAVEQVDLAVGEPGILNEINAKEGDQVSKDQLLLKVDDTKEQADLLVAQAKLKAAAEKAADEVNIKYAIESEKVAKSTYDRNVYSNKLVPGSIPIVQLLELELKVTESTLAIEKARREKVIAGFEAGVAEAEVKAATLAVNKHEVKSPIEGVVTDVRKHSGEWVQPSDAVLKIVRLNRIWVEGRVKATEYAPADLQRCDATVDVELKSHQPIQVKGKVVFVKPIAETGDSFLVRVEIENRKVGDSWVLCPGLPATMTIQVNPAIIGK